MCWWLPGRQDKLRNLQDMKLAWEAIKQLKRENATLAAQVGHQTDSRPLRMSGVECRLLGSELTGMGTDSVVLLCLGRTTQVQGFLKQQQKQHGHDGAALPPPAVA